MIKCTNCGNYMQSVVKFCGSCGTPNTAPPAPEPAPVPAAPDTPAPVEPVTPSPVPVVPAPVPAEPAAPEPVVPPSVPVAPIVPPPAPVAPVVPPPAPIVPDVPAYAAPAVAVPPKAPFSLFGLDIKKLAIIGAAGIFALAALIFALIMLMPSQYKSFRGSISVAQTENDRFFVVLNKGANIKVDGVCVDYEVNIDGTKAVLLVSDDNSISGNTLYHVSGGKISRISEDVRSYWFASSGNGVAYTKYESGSETAELYLWNNNSSRIISRDVMLNSRAVISPDGKTVGFVDLDDNGPIGAFYTGGKPTDLGTNFIPIGISDGAKYVYYTREDALFVQRGTNEGSRTRLTGEFRGVDGFNSDMSQIIYSSNSRSFISNKGGDPSALTGHVRDFILPENTAVFHGQRGTVYGVNNFKNTFYLNTDSAVIRIDGRLETERVQGSVSAAFLANDGKTLTYMRNGRIERMDGSKTGAEPVRLVGDGDVWSFVATAKGDAVFYINSDMDIRYQKGTGRAVDIAYDVSWGTHLSLFKGATLFYIQDNDLYSTSGGRGVRIGGLKGDVIGTASDMFNVYVIVRDGSEELYYHSTNGKNFSEIR